MRSVYEWPQGVWWGYAWDERATIEGVSPEGAMRYRQCASREEAANWAEKIERYVITRYRARCAYESGAACVKQEWAEHYRGFAEIDAIAGELEQAG